MTRELLCVNRFEIPVPCCITDNGNDRYKAAAALVATGNSKAASRASNVPASTIRHWAHDDEDFQSMCQEMRAEFDDKIKYKYFQIIDESTVQVLDRLRNGDVVRDNKTGELVRVPVKAKEAAIIIPWILFAAAANALYHEGPKKKIERAKATVENKKDRLKYLRQIGGVHSWVVWVFGAGVPGLVLIAILIPMLADG